MRKSYAALIVGAGIGGIRAALDLAETGQQVALIDQSPNIGGLLAQLDYQFPSNHCGMCKMLPLTERDASSQFCLRKGLFHKNIDILLSTKLNGLAGEPGNFQLTLKQRTSLIDPHKCIGCGECARVCPVHVPNEFNANLTMRPAIYLPVPHNLPNHYVVDLANCSLCGQCLEACPTQAIDFANETRGNFAILLADGGGAEAADHIQKWLAENGFALQSVHEGQAALEILAAEKELRLLLINVSTPDISASRIVSRALELHPEVKIICMHEGDEPPEEVSQLEGVHTFIPIPNDHDTFISWLDKLYLNMRSEKKFEIEAAAVILAGGFDSYDPSDQAAVLGFGRHPGVVTTLAFERMCSGTGPGNKPFVRPADGRPIEKIAWLQCVGSRDLKRNAEYCSSVCCMVAVKEAMLSKRLTHGSAQATIFYMDMRTFGKNFERYRQAAENEAGVRFIASRIHTVIADPDCNQVSVEYLNPEGLRIVESFDLVVLSTGARPHEGIGELADVTGIALNKWGFPESRPFAPASSSQLGIFVAGAFAMPRDIADSVITANSAALEASRLINIYAPLKERVPEPQPEYRNVSKESPKQLIAICSSCPILEARVDMAAISKKLAFLDAVSSVILIKRACTKEGWRQIEEKAHADAPNRILIGACLPYAYVPKLRELGIVLNLNPAMMDVVDVYSPTMHRKASEQKFLIEREIYSTLAMASTKLIGADPSPLPAPVQVVREALIVGGGLAGMTAAMGIADHGYGVCLVEQTRELGGMALQVQTTLSGDDPQKFMHDLIEQVQKHPHIRVLTNARVSLSQGRAGRFMSMITTDAGSMALEHGVTVMATGGKEARNHVYGYPANKCVITQRMLEDRLASGELDAGALDSIVMIQCVGSREEPRNYCSRVCCANAVKNILTLKKRNPDLALHVLYRDIMTYGFAEAHYTLARNSGAVFIRYDRNRKPDVTFEDNRPITTVFEPVLRETIDIRSDLLVLSNGMEPSDVEDLVEIFGVQVDSDGFFREAESKWRPVEFSKQGIFMCGVAYAPGNMAETVASAKAAAQRALRVLSEKRLVSNHIVAEVRHTLCSQCGRCIDVCPYGARRLDVMQHKIRVDELLCQGCGSCAAICPNSASVLRGFRDDQVLAEIDAAVKEYV